MVSNIEQDPVGGLVAKIGEILEKHKIPYLITGSIALIFWGRTRFTADIDVVAALVSQKLDELAEELLKVDKYAYVDKGAMRDALERHGEFNFIHGASGLKVDFWVLKDDQFARAQLQRKVAKKIQGQKVYFASAEDLILNKFLWHKESGSALQLEDVKSILERQKHLDMGYLKSWAKVQSTSEILETLLKKPNGPKNPLHLSVC